MMRSLLLYLSGAGWAKAFVTHFFLARRAARRFIAGEKLEEAIAATRVLNEKGLLVSLDYLGESVYDKQMALGAVEDYLNILDAIYCHQLNANISVKLTQLGLDIDEAFCTDNMRQILAKAGEIGTTVNIDMESSAYTDATVRIFRQLRADFGNVGTVLQSYLYRTEEDMRTLAAEGATIRLCKGAYKEPPEVAFPEKADVDSNFIQCMQLFMTPENHQKGAYLKVATHDPNMIAATLDHVKANNIQPNQFEFQMLYGIRPDTQIELVGQGYQMRVYVPYGTAWYPYFMRRLAERPANVWFILKNLFSR